MSVHHCGHVVLAVYVDHFNVLGDAVLLRCAPVHALSDKVVDVWKGGGGGA